MRHRFYATPGMDRDALETRTFATTRRSTQRSTKISKRSDMPTNIQKRSNCIETYCSPSIACNQVSESPCSASHLMSGLRHLNAWVWFFSRVYPFSGWAENTCVPWDGQLKWKSEHLTQVSSKKASCSRHPHLLNDNSTQHKWDDLFAPSGTVQHE